MVEYLLLAARDRVFVRNADDLEGYVYARLHQRLGAGAAEAAHHTMLFHRD